MSAPEAAMLPCPFCGGEAQHYHRSDTTGWSNTDWVSCNDDDCGVSTALEADKAEAIAAWNRRAGQSHDAGLLAALTAENERLAGIVRGWHWLAVGPDEMGDYLHQRELIKASEPYASPALKSVPPALPRKV